MNCSKQTTNPAQTALLLSCLLATGAGWTPVILAEDALIRRTPVPPPLRLTNDGLLKRDPCFLDDGKTIVYCHDVSDSQIQIVQLDVASRQITPFFDATRNKHQIEPAFSASGRFMAFNECTSNLSARLVIRDLSTETDVYITHSGWGGTRSPAISPTDEHVVYAFAEKGPQQLWCVATDGKEKRQLTDSSGICNWPAYTPDGEMLVYADTRENNYEIYMMHVDGSDARRLTENTMMDIRPAVSPDGKQISFTSTRNGNYEIYIMDIDGNNVRRVTHHEERDDYSAWHPDGRLLIVSERAGQFDLYLYDLGQL